MKRKYIDLLHEVRMWGNQIVIPLVRVAQNAKIINQLNEGFGLQKQEPARTSSEFITKEELRRELDAILKEANNQNNY